MRIDLDKSIKLNKLKRILKLFGNTNKPIKILIQGNLYDITSIVDRNNTIMFIIGDCDDESLVLKSNLKSIKSKMESEKNGME